MKISLDEQIKCVEREIGMREQHYPKWVQAGKLMETKAKEEIARMKAVLSTLRRLSMGVPVFDDDEELEEGTVCIQSIR